MLADWFEKKIRPRFADQLCAEYNLFQKPPLQKKGAPVDHGWWPMMPENGILVAEWIMIQEIAT